MKHIFYVHSHITFVVANQYIKEQGLIADDCYWLCARNYVISDKWPIYQQHEWIYPTDVLPKNTTRLWQGYRLDKTRKILGYFENFVRQKCNGEHFLFYVPNTMGSDVSSVLVSMDTCDGYYLIEEGFSSYSPKCDLPHVYSGLQKYIVDWLLKPLFSRFYVLRGEMFYTDHPKFKGTISTSSKCFPDIQSGVRIVIGLPFSKCELDVVPDVLLSIDSTLLRFYSLNEAAHVFELIKNNLKEGQIKIAFKFHPVYYSHPEVIEQYRVLLQEIFGKQVVELDRTVVIENVLNTYHSDFYSDTSSVALYAKQMSAACYSYANYLLRSFPNAGYSAFINSAPQIVKESYTNL